MASSSRSAHKQKALLEAKETRRALTQIKDASSSLVCLRDSASFNSLSTRSTDRSSLISRIFTFDSELMESQVYQKQLRSLIKKAIRTPNRTTRSNASKDWKDSRLRSEEVESQLKHYQMSRLNEIKILMQGSYCAKLTVLALMKDMHEGRFTREERLDYRKRLQTRTMDSMLSFVTFVQLHFSLPKILAAGKEVDIHPSAPPHLRSASLEAIDTSWKDCNISQQFRESRDNLDHEKDI